MDFVDIPVGSNAFDRLDGSARQTSLAESPYPDQYFDYARETPTEVTPLSFAINGRFLSQSTTGVQRVARELTRALDRILTERPELGSAVLVAGKDAAMADLDLQSIQLVQLGTARRASWEQWQLPRAVGARPLLCLGNTAPARMLLRRRKVAVMVHDLSYRIFPEAYGAFYRLGHSALLPILLRRAEPIFTVSQTERLMLSSLMEDRSSKVVVAPNGGWHDDWVDERPFDIRRCEGPILYVGSFSRRKNFLGSIACAVKLALRDGRRSLFIGSGGGFLSAVDAEIPEAARPYIEFRGQVESLEELKAAYRSAACLLFPSFYEASPMPPVEAFALGCPVVTSDIPSLRERCGDAAIYCQPDDIDDMISCVDRVTRDPALAAKQVEKGYARVRALSWRRQAETVLAAMRRSFAPTVDGGLNRTLEPGTRTFPPQNS